MLVLLLLLLFPGCVICLELRPAHIFCQFVYMFLAGFCKCQLKENGQRLSYFGCCDCSNSKEKKVFAGIYCFVGEFPKSGEMFEKLKKVKWILISVTDFYVP